MYLADTEFLFGFNVNDPKHFEIRQILKLEPNNIWIPTVALVEYNNLIKSQNLSLDEIEKVSQKIDM